MAQGPRRGWVRAAFTGLGALLCAGAIGCTGLDKPAPPKIGTNTGTGAGATGKQVGPGLPGTPTLPGASGTGTGMGMGANRTPSTGFGNPAAGMGSSGVMQTGGTTNPTGTMGYPTGGSFNSPTGRQPVGGYNPNSTSGMGYPPVGGGGITPSVQPPGGSGGFGGMPQPNFNTTSGSNFNPPAVGLNNPEPPLPPDRYNTGSVGGPIAPPQSPVQPYNTGVGGFGNH